MRTDLDVACHLNVLTPDLEPARLDAALRTLADLGYRRVVLPPLDPDTTDTATLRTALAGAGLSPITIAAGVPGAHVAAADPDERAAGVAALRRAAEFTAELGGDQLNGVPYGLFGAPAGPTTPEVFARSAAAVGAVADHAHTLGVTMTFEVLNRYETSVVNTAEQAMRFVAGSGSEHLRIHLDTFHMAVEEADIAAAIRLARPRLGYLELGQSGRGSLAHGAVDVTAVVRDALAAGYTGRWGVEAFSRAVLDAPVAGTLAIWREPYHDGAEVAAEAMDLIVAGHAR